MAIRADDVDLGRDRLLVERFQSGDVAGFEDLYRRYYRRLFRFCLKRVGDAQEAEELTQEAFTRAYSAMPRFAGERRFYPWLSVIAARLCSDSHRRRSRSEARADIDPGAVDGGQDRVLAAVDRDLVREALSRLGPRHRDVLRLREEEGWSYQRIATHFDVTIGAVEQLLWRARRSLRREFEHVAGADGRLAAGLPLIGWLGRRLHELRARVDSVATQAAPVLANAAVTLAIVAGSAATLAGDGSTTRDAPIPEITIRATAPAVAVAPPSAAPVEQLDRPAASGRAGGTGADAPFAPVPQVAALPITSAEEAREEGKHHPVKVEAAETWVSADPVGLLDDIASMTGGRK